MRAPLLFLVCSGLLAAYSVAFDQHDYYPSSDGGEWIMNAQVVSPSGAATPATAHRKVEGQVEKDGKTYRRMRTWSDIGSSPKEFLTLFRKDEGGCYTLSEQEKDAVEQTEMIFPIKVGRTWTRIFQGVNFTATLVGVESVIVGDKTYDECLHIRAVTADGKMTEDYWEAPKVGTVKADMVYPNGVKLILTIREFKPGK